MMMTFLRTVRFLVSDSAVVVLKLSPSSGLVQARCVKTRKLSTRTCVFVYVCVFVRLLGHLVHFLNLAYVCLCECENESAADFQTKCREHIRNRKCSFCDYSIKNNDHTLKMTFKLAHIFQ